MQWMRILSTAAALMAIALMQGCAGSINPVVDKGALVEDDSLYGTWVRLNPITDDADADSPNREDIYAVVKQDDGYEVIMVPGEGMEVDSVHVYLFRMGEGLYFDMVFNWRQDADGTFWSMSDVPAIPVHFLGRIERHNDTIMAFVPNAEWLEQSLQTGALKLGHYGAPGEDERWSILTASPRELREFLKQYGNDANAFSLSGSFQRVKSH